MSTVIKIFQKERKNYIDTYLHLNINDSVKMHYKQQNVCACIYRCWRGRERAKFGGIIVGRIDIRKRTGGREKKK